MFDRPIGRRKGNALRLTSFREIHISVMSVVPSGGRPAAARLQDMRLSKSSTLTNCSEVLPRSSSVSGSAQNSEREKYKLLVQIVEQGTQKALFVG